MVGHFLNNTKSNWIAAIWIDGQLANLNSLLDAETISSGWELQTAFDINDQGWIVGDAYNRLTDTSRGFLLVPNVIPEPPTLVLVGVAIVGLWANRRRKSQRRSVID